MSRSRPRVLTRDGRSQTIAEWARELSITRQALEQRLKRAELDGSPLEAELDPKRQRRPRARKPHKPHKRRCDAGVPNLGARMLTYDGRRQSAREWAREFGLTVSTIMTRLGSGWSVERALSTPPRAASERTFLTCDGRTQSMAAWARELGLTLDALAWRIAHWEVEPALTTPRRAQGRPRARR